MDFIRKNYKLVLLLIPLISFIMHLHIFKLDLVGIHVWRQTQTQTVINNFYQGSMDITDPVYNDFNRRSLKMEFPVMQWLFACVHKVLGSDIAITRILTFILGLCSVFGVFRLADVIFRNKVPAVLCAWMFNWSPLFYYYTVNPLPDNFALCCGIWSAVFFFRYINAKLLTDIILSAIFLCLSALAKLPFILYGSIVIAYLLILLRNRELSLPTFIKTIVIYLAALIPVLLWYMIAIPTWEGNGVVKGVFDNAIGFSAVMNILTGHLTSILPELVLNYGSVLFFLAGFYLLFRNGLHRRKYFPVLLLWSICITVYFLYEINMITLVHDYYLFPFMPLIFLIAAYGGWKLISSKSRFLRYFSLVLLTALPVLAYLRTDSRWNTEEPGFNPVYYHYKNELRTLIPEQALCVTGNDDSHYITLYYLNRKGWSFDNNWLEGAYLEEYIRRGAKYLSTDSDIDKNEDIRRLLDEKIFEEGTLRVYTLKPIY